MTDNQYDKFIKSVLREHQLYGFYVGLTTGLLIGAATIMVLR